MTVAVITGSSGLVGSCAVELLHEKGLDVVGIDNDMRARFFGRDASVAWNTHRLVAALSRFRHFDSDIRDQQAIENIFKHYGSEVGAVVHCAAQPSHDWAARDPLTDFSINAQGTLVLLEATRASCPDAVFIYMSTNKVYGDTPNRLPLIEKATRWELAEGHAWFARGIDESMSIDQTKHSVFGASKVAADVMVQEYGRYFGLRTAVFRGGCLTGPAHSGAELHGFLAYLVKCAVNQVPYIIHGYGGKQVRDNIHAADLVSCFWEVLCRPMESGVYNIGGGRHCNCSILEAIEAIREISGLEVKYSISERARSGDHIWWISDVSRFSRDYPDWNYRYDLRGILGEMLARSSSRCEVRVS